ncbi:MAG: competence protein [Deltaproteobacteria bacterium]|nr:MAG: competence protein [Deltaproteobacteria bacterium]
MITLCEKREKWPVQGEIITIGNELTSGMTLDVNGWYAAGRLTASGLQVTRITSVGDDYASVSQALKSAMKESSFVIVTGGLGSTDDDITNEIVSKALQRPLCLDKEMFEIIKRHTASHGAEMCRSLEKMAWVPDGSKMLSPEGKACGFSLVENDVRLYFLPGVPDQMRYLIDHAVIPELRSLYTKLPVTMCRTLKVYGLSEPRIAEIFRDLNKKTGKALIGFYPHFPENHITVSLTTERARDGLHELDRIETLIRKELGPAVFATGEDSMAEIVGKVLSARKLTVSVAESCTGGLIGHLLTAVPGSSRYFLGGIVSYGNEAKTELLGVQAETLEDYGAVSNETVREMAEGVRNRLHSDLGIAVSGIAGPGGGTREKPVGTVHLSLASAEETPSQGYRFWGNRHAVKLNSATMALDWIRRYANGDPLLPGI